ncbi:MAG: hypothetical protein IKX92_05400, partial [Clostridia bacterium]|nr:hypothetical protein [Clostridia bacterium]
ALSQLSYKPVRLTDDIIAHSPGFVNRVPKIFFTPGLPGSSLRQALSAARSLGRRFTGNSGGKSKAARAP